MEFGIRARGPARRHALPLARRRPAGAGHARRDCPPTRCGRAVRACVAGSCVARVAVRAYATERVRSQPASMPACQRWHVGALLVALRCAERSAAVPSASAAGSGTCRFAVQEGFCGGGSPVISSTKFLVLHSTSVLIFVNDRVGQPSDRESYGSEQACHSSGMLCELHCGSDLQVLDRQQRNELPGWRKRLFPQGICARSSYRPQRHGVHLRHGPIRPATAAAAAAASATGCAERSLYSSRRSSPGARCIRLEARAKDAQPVSDGPPQPPLNPMGCAE